MTGLVGRAFGELVRERRLAAGRTQQDLAAATGLSVRALRDIERGRVRRPHGRSLQRLSAVLGLASGDTVAPAPETARRGGRASQTPAGAPTGRWTVGVLGELMLARGGQLVALTQAKQRQLLGLLALQPNQTVAVDEIIDALWGDRPPVSCLNLVHTHVARLRRALTRGRPDQSGPIRYAAGGYRLVGEPDQVDVSRFDELTAAAAAMTGDTDALAVFGEAVAL